MAIRCVDLRCERLRDPIGIGTAAPRLSWKLVADDGEIGVVQNAWEVETDNGWSASRVDGRRQQVRYGGPSLPSCAVVRWRVRVWTNHGETDWSEWAAFETSILEPHEWTATMITADAATPVVRFARTVAAPDDIVGARLRLTAHGVVTATINGVPVSQDVLVPGWTSCNHRLVVRTYDVTALVAPGDIELAATVAPGWFSGRIGFGDAPPIYGRHVGALVQLELERGDGSRVVVGTDDTWTATSTRYSVASIYDGERYDARLPESGDAAPVSIVSGFDHAVLCAPTVPPVRRTQELVPVSSRDGVFDFGQNLVGWLRLRLRGVAPGTTVVLRHAEVLDAEGRLFTVPLRTAAATDTYIACGDDEEEYEPRFTFHGFRYAEITGVDLASVDVVAVVIHSDLERTGSFTCSDPLVERLHENTVWGWRGNSVAVPTDCPQRDERLGWTGDAQVFAPTASFLYDCETFWENWLADLAADQHPNGSVPHVIPRLPAFEGHGAAGWGDAAVVIPWATYLAYGDDSVLRASLPSMAAWVDYVFSRLDDEHRWMQDFQFGDWLDPDAPTEKPWRAKARFDLVATAYAAHVVSLLATAAEVVGDAELAATSRQRAATVRSAWWTHYGESAARTQTGAALAIAFDLAPDDEARLELGEALALRVHEAGDHLATGFLGTPVLLPALTDTGHVDVAYSVLLQRTCPSWLYPVLAGATTIWERWDALRPDSSIPLAALGTGSGDSMVSFNHYAYGAVAAWLHTTVAGLRPDPDDPGYHHVLIEPRPGGGLTHAAASLTTPYGLTSVGWRLDDGGALRLDVTLPPNTSATVTLPGRAPLRVGSGTHAL